MFTTSDAELRALDDERLKELAGQRGRYQKYASRAICSALVQRGLGSDEDVKVMMKRMYDDSGQDPWIQRLGCVRGEESSFASDSRPLIVDSTPRKSMKRKREDEDSCMKLSKLARKYLFQEQDESKENLVQNEKEQEVEETKVESDHQEDIERCCNLLSEYSKNVELSQSDSSGETSVVNTVVATLRKAGTSGESCFRGACERIVASVPNENLDFVLTLCRSFLTVDLSPADASCFVSMLLLPLAESLERPASRSLYCAVVSVSEHHPTALVDALIMPILGNTNGVGRPQTELIKRIVREHMSSANTSNTLLGRVVETSWTDSMLPIVQTLLNLKDLSVSESLMNSIIRRLDLESQSSSSSFTKSVKFAAVLNTLVKKFSSKLQKTHVSELRRILERCTAFMAKVALKALNRLDASSS
eukprot:g3650.t1